MRAARSVPVFALIVGIAASIASTARAGHWAMISASTGASRIGPPNMDGGSRSGLGPLKRSLHREGSSSDMNKASTSGDEFAMVAVQGTLIAERPSPDRREKRAVMLANFCQLMNARWLRRLSDLSLCRRTSLKYHLRWSVVAVLGPNGFVRNR
jgi:hypothetical protein